ESTTRPRSARAPSAPGSIVRAQRVLLALGPARQRRIPSWLHAVAAAAGSLVDRLAPYARDLGDVARAALAALDLDRRHPSVDQLGQDCQRIQAGRLLDRIVALAARADDEAPLAQRRVA